MDARRRYDSVKSFDVHLTPPASVRSGYRVCRVRIYNVDMFPNGQTFDADELLGRVTARPWRARISIIYHFIVSAHRGTTRTSVRHQACE